MGLEGSNVLARAEAKGLVTEARSEAFLELLDGLDLELSLRTNLPLATLDEALRKAAKKSGVKRFAVK